MIIDVHSHCWSEKEHLSEAFRAQAAGASKTGVAQLATDRKRYRRAAPADTVRVIFGGKARRAGIWVDDSYIAESAARYPTEMIGFLSVDPTQPGWIHELKFGHEHLGLQGIKLLPMYAGFRPDEPRLEPLWSYAEAARLPVLLHTGTTFVAQAPIECTLPRHVDNVAIAHPAVTIILAHLAHPFGGECVAVIRKHPNVYADLSALHGRPWQLYNTLMLVQEYGVWHKVLFGTDFPFATVSDTIDGLRGLNTTVAGTALPLLDETALEAVIHRDVRCILFGSRCTQHHGVSMPTQSLPT